MAYIVANRTRYKPLLIDIIKEESWDAVLRVLKDYSRDYISRGPARSPCYSFDYYVSDELLEGEDDRIQNDETCGRTIFRVWPHITQIARELYRKTGDDAIELGLYQLNGSMLALAQLLAPRDSKRAKWRLSTALIRDDVLKYFANQVPNISVSTAFNPHERISFCHVFHAGDYDTDRDDYNALRENNSTAVERWAADMAGIITENPLLAKADVLIPILGREQWGWPVAVLAKQIGEKTGKEVNTRLWVDRPADKKEGEAYQTFAQKEEQAEKSHRILEGLESEIEGKTVVLIDDNYTTGATYRAAAGALRNAGAKDVYLVAATKTQRRVERL